MIQELELSEMDTDDTTDFDNERDDWQDELRGVGIPTPTTEGIFLFCASVVAVLFVVVVMLVEAWRILTNG
jgi:hypothetical protein